MATVRLHSLLITHCALLLRPVLSCSMAVTLSHSSFLCLLYLFCVNVCVCVCVCQVWDVSTVDGRDLYGDNYAGVVDIARAHAKLAGSKDCDHLHDGLGFMTQHMALSLMMEQSLQSVDGALAMPYWDYTIDMHNYKNGNWSSLEDSPLWTDDWFGKVPLPPLLSFSIGRSVAVLRCVTVCLCPSLCETKSCSSSHE